MADARGTIGCIAPEVFSRNFGGVSSKSDVYSYGMMILEMVGGRKNTKVGLWEDTTSEENKMARKMILVGLWCIQTKPSDRPSMSRVIDMLQESLEALHLPPNPFMFSPRSPEKLPSDGLLEESSTTSVP
ncbi:hypothetical protein TIFTF001_035435 [Ficus carica]|uniref:Protein kinase domain-containing protein n=1 Tax=Ficus carica TaxID=3494 RepID=A0AA88E1Z0_FICCA|nr:hypothetical protein TIFTF001_035435 [Ficus carica]